MRMENVIPLEFTLVKLLGNQGRMNCGVFFRWYNDLIVVNILGAFFSIVIKLGIFYNLNSDRVTFFRLLVGLFIDDFYLKIVKQIL